MVHQPILHGKMKSSALGQPKDTFSMRSCIVNYFPAASLFVLLIFTGITFIEQYVTEESSIWSLAHSQQYFDTILKGNSSLRENSCRFPGTEMLPQGIVSQTSNLERRPLWGSVKKSTVRKSLFAAAVGIKQKKNIDKMVQKFLSSNFSVILFHYDSNLDGWRDLEWNDLVIHVSALNQTKWWFAKRFLHPDIVAEYNYIFLWDEDLGVDNFDPDRYLEIVKREGLEISQPGLDTNKSEVHHQITARGRREDVHRRTFKAGNDETRCDENSTGPPCTGWIEVMAPVFSRASWPCVWSMIQNDMIHAWGLDIKLGYCAQGDRMRNIGVVDAEYIVHYNLPTLGDPSKKETYTDPKAPKKIDFRVEVRRQSYNELKLFERRWKKAVEDDKSYKDPYPAQGAVESVVS